MFLRRPPASAFTLVELLVTVVVLSIGMVFLLSTLNQCLFALTTAEKTATANYLLHKVILQGWFWWEGRSQPAGVFQKPYQNFHWTRSISPVISDFESDKDVIQEALYEERTRIFWKQGKSVKDVSVVRYVTKISVT